jgi:uncharacterized protein YdeI (YjbR/CyaY-like superfamily)
VSDPAAAVATFFETPRDFRAWLAENHETAEELWVGFHKKATGKPSITWPEAVDEALCVGWIDGLRRSLGDESYMIRFTPRKPRSTWSAVNIARAEELVVQGRMRPVGLRAFEARSDDNSAIYAYEQRHAARLEPEQEREFRANEQAWAYFRSRPPSYRKTAIWWVVSAKREETKAKRLRTLIEDSAQGRTIRRLTRPADRSDPRG